MIARLQNAVDFLYENVTHLSYIYIYIYIEREREFARECCV